jgi:predicted nucleic acid-binding protein
MAYLVVVDAGALIALLDENHKHHRWAFGMFQATLGLGLVMPALTYAEVLVHPTRAGQADTFENNIAGLGLDIRPIFDTDTRGLAEIRAESSLKMPDAIVLQLALAEQATLATTDTSLATEAQNRGLKVLAPH